MNSGNSCYHSVQNILSSRLLSKYIKIKIYKTIILPVLFSGCETWSLKLTVEHRMTVFEKRVLRRTFGPTREEVTGDWRRLHKEEFHDLCSFFHGATAPSGPGRPHCRGDTITFSYTHHLRQYSLDEWSARRRDLLYLTTHYTHRRQPPIQPTGFEPAIPAVSGRRPTL